MVAANELSPENNSSDITAAGPPQLPLRRESEVKCSEGRKRFKQGKEWLDRHQQMLK